MTRMAPATHDPTRGLSRGRARTTSRCSAHCEPTYVCQTAPDASGRFATRSISRSCRPILLGRPRRLRSMASPSSHHDPHRHYAISGWPGAAVTSDQRCPTFVSLRRGGHASASVASCRPAGAQGNRLPARSGGLLGRCRKALRRLRQAETERLAGGLVARLRAVWRGE